MYHVTTPLVDTTPPPRPGIQTHVLRARDYGDGYTLRALIADAEQAGDQWIAFTNVAPPPRHYLVSEATVFVRGRNCRTLDLADERDTLIYG
jgi:hypothetical protein